MVDIVPPVPANLVQYITNGVFPYHKYFLDAPETMFRRLVETVSETSVEPYNVKGVTERQILTIDPEYPEKPLFRSQFDVDVDPGYLFLKLPKDHFYMFDALSDWFNEESRMEASFADYESPIDWWSEYKNREHTLIAAYVLAKERGEDQPMLSDLRTAMFRSSRLFKSIPRLNSQLGVRETQQFSPLFTRFLIQLFSTNPTCVNVLDISAGWGDRLLGSIAAGVNSYLGYDPNSKLQRGYNSIIKKFGDRERHQVIQSPFENAKLQPETYDLVISSPPFFTVEHYTKEGPQSEISYNTFDVWLKEFLFRSVTIAWNALVPGGYLILYLADVRELKYKKPLSKLFSFIYEHFTDVFYLGAIGRGKLDVTTEGIPILAPVFVWWKYG